YLISRGLFMTFNFLGPGLTVNVEAKVKEQIILDSSEPRYEKSPDQRSFLILLRTSDETKNSVVPTD
ncbi:hypothetical protein, partial [Parasutterella excrementihominis]|uniref:hypothetical protein n=1 Tax=Parasutterella excrementihominis TaxID=487175 RepID=UPI003AF04F98